jgi:hypothetical protein
MAFFLAAPDKVTDTPKTQIEYKEQGRETHNVAEK